MNNHPSEPSENTTVDGSESNVVTVNEGMNQQEGPISSEMPQPLEEVPLRHAEATSEAPTLINDSVHVVPFPAEAPTPPAESNFNGVLRNIATLTNAQQCNGVQ